VYSGAAAFSRTHLTQLAIITAEGKMLRTVLLIVLILILLGSVPMWPYSTGWGYGPSGVVGLILLILIILIVMGRL
jgi:hypothetical protein